jgi:hypothetical protein
MHGIGFDLPLNEWFDFKIPRTNISSNYISKALDKEEAYFISPSAKIIWLESQPKLKFFTKTKKGSTYEIAELTFYTKEETIQLQMSEEQGKWLEEMLPLISVSSPKNWNFQELQDHYYTKIKEDFEPFWYGKSISQLRDFGLLVL